MNNIPIVEDLPTLYFLFYDIDLADGNVIGELARRTVQKKRKNRQTVDLQ